MHTRADLGTLVLHLPTRLWSSEPARQAGEQAPGSYQRQAFLPYNILLIVSYPQLLDLDQKPGFGLCTLHLALTLSALDGLWCSECCGELSYSEMPFYQGLILATAERPSCSTFLLRAYKEPDPSSVSWPDPST